MKARKRIVLVGGGHAHVQVLTAFRDAPVDADVVLVSEAADTPYSGMLPGCVAGLYTPREIHIDLAALAKSCGVQFEVARVSGIDRPGRRLHTEDARSIPYDIASFDVGIRPDLSGIAGAEHHGVAVKPISDFLDKFDALLAQALREGGVRRIAIIGGGPAGVELAFAFRARFERDAPLRDIDPAGFDITIVSAGPLISRLNDSARRRVERALAARGIHVLQGVRASAVDEAGVEMSDGSRLAADAVVISTHARPPSWLGRTGMPTTEDGSLALRATLQLVDDVDVFAAGDCASIEGEPREKAGVFAVRQGPVLADNLTAHLRGERLKAHEPQREFLTLLSTGDGRAIGARGGWISFSGRAAFLLKDWIDRRFMARFQV
jgi:pyridine nucleotide-disulfide oxidoreductase family protein